MTDIEGYLSAKGVDYRVHGDEAVAICPECGGGQRKAERCWSVNLETGAFICNRANHCGWKGSFKDLQSYFGDQPIGRPKLMPAAKRTLIHKKPDTTKLRGLDQEHVAWFTSRGISRETVEAFGISGKPGAIAFPVTNPAGELVNLKWRAVPEKKFWNEEGTLRLPFGLNLCPDPASLPEAERSLLIVEGELDAMAAYQYGVRRVISLPNGTGDQDWIDPLWDWLDQWKVIWLATDMDEAGQGVRRLLVERLGLWRCRGVNLPEKDLNDCLMAGVTPERILELFNQAEDFKPERLRNAGEFADAVVKTFSSREALIGVSSGFQALDQLIKGWRAGELSVWTGHNGSGKSTVLGQIALNLLNLPDQRVCVASLELAAARYLRWLVCQYGGKSDPSEASIRYALEAMGAGMWLVDHVGSIQMPILIDTFTYAARRYGVRHFIVDSLVKLKLHGEELLAQREAVEALCDFADRFDAHVHLVAHPRKGESDGSRVDKVSVKGSGDITDLADNVFAVRRNTKPKEGQSNLVLSVLKNREHGIEGTVPLSVDPDSKRVTGFTVTTGSGGGYGRGNAVRTGEDDA